MVFALGVAPAVFAPPLYDDFTLAKQSALLVGAALLLLGMAASPEAFPRRRIVRYAFGALVAWTTFAWLMGEDPLGGTLGVYQYRQGYLTELAYFAIFLGGVATVRMGLTRLAVAAVGAGFVAATAYTAVQSAGADPVHWWTDTSGRAIGTIGNANELASYALVALAFLGLASPGGGRRRALVLTCAGAAACFVILEAESRSGLLSLAIAVACIPAAAELARGGRREAWREAGLVAGGCALGLGLSLAAGGASATLDRVESGGRLRTLTLAEGEGSLDTAGEGAPTVEQDVGVSTRFALWEGALPSLLAAPVWGSGPDGLFLSFPKHRQEQLGGAFEAYDLTVQSSHNLILDTATNTGLVGLALSALLTIAVGVRSLRMREHRMAGSHVAWGVIAGYLAITMLNPLSLAAQATFCALLGVMEGHTQAGLPAPRRAEARWAKQLGWAAAALILAVVAIVQPLADVRADDAWGAYAAGDFRGAAASYETAAELMPLSRDYSRRAAVAWLQAGDLEAAERALVRFDSRFGAASNEVFDLAAVRIALGRPAAETLPLIERGEALNPHGLGVEAYAAGLREATASGAVEIGFSPWYDRASLTPR